MENVSNLLVPTDATLRDAIEAIDRGARQVALVVRKDGVLEAVVTDGDIRRGLLRGLGLDAPVSEVMNRNPVTAPASDGHEGALRIMRARALHHVPLVDETGRLVDLAWIDEIASVRARSTRVVIMAGGLGKRLRPLTEDLPKPMLPVGGRPLLELIIRSLVEQGFRRITVSINYLGHIIQQHFGDGSTYGAEIDYIEETTRMGTAGALSLLPEWPSEPFVVMNGDLLTSVRFSSLLDFHNETDAFATMCAREYDVEIPYGVIKADGSRLVELEEKPIRSHFVNAGIYVLDPKILDYVHRDSPMDMPDLFARIMSAGHEASVFPIREYWKDIGHPDDLDQARAELQEVFGE